MGVGFQMSTTSNL